MNEFDKEFFNDSQAEIVPWVVLVVILLILIIAQHPFDKGFLFFGLFLPVEL
jgi:hypothetical protein